MNRQKPETGGGLENSMVPLLYRVRRIRRETHDTVSLELESKNSASGFRFAPGQFNMLYVFGVGEVPISISGDPGKPECLLHTVRGVGTATGGLLGLRKEDTLGVRGPFGNPWPIEETQGSDVLIIAGGIGLAPLRPAIYSLLAQRDKFGKIAILYGARKPADLLYRRELEQWRGRFDLQVEVTVDTAKRGWRGHVGVVPALISKVNFDPMHSAAMICGPEVMMRFTVLELKKHGIGEDTIYVSMERNMKCATGFCGHCQFGPTFICKDGPVFRLERIKPFFGKREI